MGDASTSVEIPAPRTSLAIAITKVPLLWLLYMLCYVELSVSLTTLALAPVSWAEEFKRGIKIRHPESYVSTYGCDLVPWTEAPSRCLEEQAGLSSGDGFVYCNQPDNERVRDP